LSNEKSVLIRVLVSEQKFGKFAKQRQTNGRNGKRPKTGGGRKPRDGTEGKGREAKERKKERKYTYGAHARKPK
jgi:hypothetical protein